MKTATAMYCSITNRHYTTSGGWWPCEERVLMTMIEDGYSYWRMAEILDRNYYAIYYKVKRIKEQRKERS